MGFCLKLWLHTPPPNTAAFLLPVLIALVIDQLTLGFSLAVAATGRIAGFSLVVSIANSVGVPAGYFLLRVGRPGTWALWAVVAGTALAGCGRLWFARMHATISIRKWLSDVLLPAVLSVLGSVAVALTFMHLLPDGLARFALITAVNCGAVCLIMWFFGTTADQRFRVRALAISVPVRLFAKPAMRTRGATGETL